MDSHNGGFHGDQKNWLGHPRRTNDGEHDRNKKDGMKMTNKDTASGDQSKTPDIGMGHGYHRDFFKER